MAQKIISLIKNNYLIIVILLLSAFLRFFHLDYQSPWLDEIHTLNEANPNASLSEVYSQILSGEQMPPLYFYILYFLFKIFGYSIFVARFFSAILGVLSVYVLYKLVKELIDKKTALVAALLFGMNYFMIYFSQEARPYTLFTLFMLLSFYRMLMYLKSSTIKNAIWFGLTASLMLHSHFIGFFTLFAQAIIFLLFLFLKKDLDKKQFFKGSIIAAIVFLIAYIPSMHSLMKIFSIKSFWISAPGPDSFKLIYKSFFGNSEIIIFLNGVLFFGFLFSFFKSEKRKNIENGETNWSAIILVLWISFTILIPLISSYISNPIILDRYFLGVLPAIIILLAIGLMQIKGKVLKIVFISIYTIFFLFDMFGVQKYYHSVKKTQFRETTSYIIEKNDKNHKVVSSLSWYLPFFFNQANKNTEIIGATLDEFVAQQMILNKDALSSFWYFDAHGRDYNPNAETLEFLNQKYLVKDNFTGLQAWTRHFVIKSEMNTKVQFSQEKFNMLISNTNCKNNFDKFEFKDNHLLVSGWAFLEDQDSKNTKIQLVLLNNLNGEIIETLEVLREDVTSYFKLNFNADNTGFISEVDFEYTQKGEYKLGIWLKNSESNIEALIVTDKIIKI